MVGVIIFSKDKHDGIVRNYSQVSFIDNSSNGNYIYRLFEIGSFFKSRKQVDYVMKLMGIESINIYPDKIEVKSLVERGQGFIVEAESSCAQKRAHLNIQNAILDKMRNGDFERGSILSMKEQIHQQQHKVNVSQSDLNNAEFNLRCHKGLLGLLRPSVRHMMDIERVKMPVGILEKIPEESIPSMAYENGGPFSAAIYKMSREYVDDFIKSVESIFKECNPLNDTHAMNSGWKFRYLHCRDYYRNDNEIIRKATSLNEFADFMTKLDMAKESKAKLIKANN